MIHQDVRCETLPMVYRSGARVQNPRRQTQFFPKINLFLYYPFVMNQKSTFLSIFPKIHRGDRPCGQPPAAATDDLRSSPREVPPAVEAEPRNRNIACRLNHSYDRNSSGNSLCNPGWKNAFYVLLNSRIIGTILYIKY